MNVTRPARPRSFWERLGDEEQRSVRELAESKIYAPGERLMGFGRPADSAMVIQIGWAKISNIHPGSNSDAIWLRTSGDIVGESASAGQRRIATVTAIGEVRALEITAPDFLEFLHLFPGARKALQQTQSDRQIEADRRCMEFGQTNGSQRLANLLLRLFERAGRVDGENGDRRMMLDIPLSQDEYGQLVRVSRSTVERTFKTWRNRGIVLTEPRRLTLLNERALRRIASADA